MTFIIRIWKRWNVITKKCFNIIIYIWNIVWSDEKKTFLLWQTHFYYTQNYRFFQVFSRIRLCIKSMSKVLGQFACWSWFVSQLHIHSICVYRYMKNVTNRLFIEDAKKCKRSKTSFEWCCWLNSGISKNELTFIFFRLYARDASCHVSTYFM